MIWSGLINLVGGRFMELNFEDESIYNQVREQYGKLVYSYTAHLKEAKILEKKSNVLKILNIVLSAVSTCGLIAIIIDWNPKLCSIVSVILTTAILVISTYLKSANYDEKILSHRSTSHLLWPLRENMISFLTDFHELSHEDRIRKRDKFISELSDIYSRELLTSEKAYLLTQDALKEKEEQFFSEEEIDAMLPASLRKNK